MKAPKDTSGEKLEAEKAVQKKHKVEEDAFGTYASQGGEKFVYRVKKSGPGGYGGYKVVTESTSSTMTREDLLQMRSKKKSDRYVCSHLCWLAIVSYARHLLLLNFQVLLLKGW